MATSTEDQRTNNALNDALRVHIADIKDDLTSDNASSTYIEAVVQLVWPFSSTVSQLSLLLIEKDVSLRDITGQIRITFHDACAKEVAKSRIGIGDVLRLNLEGVSAEAEHEELSTPGKKAGYDLHFRNKVNLQVRKNTIPLCCLELTQIQAFAYDGQVKTLKFVAPDPPVVLNGTHSTPKTPFRNGSIDITKTKLSSTTPGPKRIPRTSLNSFPGSPADPFSEDDAYTEGRRRKRTKFARRSNQWRLADASDEESEPQLEEAQHASVLDQAVTEPDVHIAPDVDTREATSIDTYTNADERQKLSQPSQSEGYRVTEAEVRTPKIIAVEEEDPVPDVQKVEFIIPDNHMPASEDSTSTSEEPHIPVERLTPDRATTLSVQTPTLTVVASPGPPLVSPLMFRNAEPPTISQVASIDGGAPATDEVTTHPPPLDRNESHEFAHVTELVSQSQSASVETAVTSAEDIQSHHAPPAAIIENVEIDLDKLQEQIDISNAEFVSEALEQVIEDEDMYGPPQDREIGMELQHIEEIRSRISSNEPESIAMDQQPVETIDEAPINSDIWGGLDGTYVSPNIPTSDPVSREIPFEALISDPIAFQPYPYHFEPPVENEEQTSHDIAADLEEHEAMSSVPEQTTGPSLHLDGASGFEAIHENFPHVFEQPPGDEIDAAQAEQIAVQLEEGRPPTTSVHFATTIEDTEGMSSPIHAYNSAPSPAHAGQQLEEDELVYDAPQAEPTVHERLIDNVPNVPINVLTPEATQITEAYAKDGSMVNQQIQAQPPPTPIESQVETSQQSIVEDSASNNDDQAMADSISMTPARPILGSNMRERDQDEGIASPYFTSHASMLTPASAMHSVKVPSSSRMRLRSSSPADLPVHHLESERLAAMEISKDQTSNLSSHVQMQSEVQGGIATPLEYYARLDTLNEYYNQQVDVMTVCAADSVTPERAKSGPKDFFTTLHLVDRSVQETNVSVLAQIFRPRKSAIPTVRRGDILLLRRFKVQTRSHKPMLLSTDESAWAVYPSYGSSNNNENDDIRVADAPLISGPPVEHGPFEADNASRLLKWWLTEGSKHQFEAAADSSPAKATRTAGSARPRKSIPAPIDLRRSPRKTRATASISANQSPTSPVFQPESPAQSQMTAPSSQSRASPHSPSSVRSTRSQISPLKFQPKPALNPPATTPLTKKQSNPQQKSLSPSPNLDNPATLSVAPPSITPRNFSSSNSVASSVTQKSGSSKRRRYERRSTSLVHKLRDGTEWVDIEQEEVFSVTDSESGSGSGSGSEDDSDDNVSEAGEAAEHDRDQSSTNIDQVQSTADETLEPQPSAMNQVQAELDTPSKKPRGRPRKNIMPVTDAAVDDTSAPPQHADELRSGISADPTTSMVPQPHTPQPENELTITTEPPSSPDPLAVDVEGKNQSRNQSQSQSQSPDQERRRVTRSQTVGSTRDGV